MTHADLAPVLYDEWVRPLAASIRMEDAEGEIPDVHDAALEFVLRWIDEPTLDLATIPLTVRKAALLGLGLVHKRLAANATPLPQHRSELGPSGAVRSLIRDRIRGRSGPVAPPQ